MTPGRRRMAAVLAPLMLLVLTAPAPGQAPAPRPWPSMPAANKKFIKVKKQAPVKKKPARTWPGLIVRTEKAFGLSVVLQNTRQDFYSEDVKQVVIGLDLTAGRIVGLVVVKDDDTWGLYAAPAYVAFFPNKRAQARRALLVWLDAAGWAKYLKKRVSTYDRE